MLNIDILIVIIFIILDLAFINWSLYKFNSGMPALIINIIMLIVILII